MNNGLRGARRLGQFLETILTVSMKKNLKYDEHDEIAEWVHWWEANDRNSNMAAVHGKATIERLELVEIVFQKPGGGAWLLSNIEESWLLSRQFTCEPLVQKISMRSQQTQKKIFKRGPYPALDYYSHPNFSAKNQLLGCCFLPLHRLRPPRCPTFHGTFGAIHQGFPGRCHEGQPCGSGIAIAAPATSNPFPTKNGLLRSGCFVFLNNEQNLWEDISFNWILFLVSQLKAESIQEQKENEFPKGVFLRPVVKREIR